MKLTRDKQLNALREAAFKKVVLPKSCEDKYKAVFGVEGCQMIPKESIKGIKMKNEAKKNLENQDKRRKKNMRTHREIFNDRLERVYKSQDNLEKMLDQIKRGAEPDSIYRLEMINNVIFDIVSLLFWQNQRNQDQFQNLYIRLNQIRQSKEMK
jgi:hypothetical protein